MIGEKRIQTGGITKIYFEDTKHKEQQNDIP